MLETITNSLKSIVSYAKALESTLGGRALCLSLVLSESRKPWTIDGNDHRTSNIGLNNVVIKPCKGLIIVIKPCTINSNDHSSSNIVLNIVIKPCTINSNNHGNSNIGLNIAIKHCKIKSNDHSSSNN